MQTWPTDWGERLAGRDCWMCASRGQVAVEYGLRFHHGEFADAFLMRAAPQRGYAIAIWRHGHVPEPSDLDEASLAGYWRDVTVAGRAIRSLLQPAKINYLTLGNSIPHLHTHIFARFLDDPAPGRPLPWELVASADHLPEQEFARDVERLRQLVSSAGK